MSASKDRTVRLWDLTSGLAFRHLQGHEDAVTSMALSPDKTHLASGSEDHAVRLWDLMVATRHIPGLRLPDDAILVPP